MATRKGLEPSISAVTGRHVNHYTTGPYELEAAPRLELGNRGFADLCLTTWLCRQKNGAENEIRTRDPRLGKAMLYR